MPNGIGRGCQKAPGPSEARSEILTLVWAFGTLDRRTPGAGVLAPLNATAYVAWKAKAQGTVDNAQMRYFIVHLHRLLDEPEAPKK